MTTKKMNWPDFFLGFACPIVGVGIAIAIEIGTSHRYNDRICTDSVNDVAFVYDQNNEITEYLVTGRCLRWELRKAR